GAAFARDALAALLRPGSVHVGAVHVGAVEETGIAGLTLDLARLPATASLGVFLLPPGQGSRIEDRSRLVQPDGVVVTGVAGAADPYGSPEAAANELAGVFTGMTANGTAILNRDDPHFFRLLAAARTAGLTRILSFGDHEDADARVSLCSLHATGSTVSATVRGERIRYRLPVPGRRHATSSLAALLAADVLGADLATAAGALDTVIETPSALGTVPASGTSPGKSPGAALTTRTQAATAAAPKS
ncbi:MAG TPA: Mur ligase family protein, partial [Arenibaculum sp.]|nr:Mur ligase family protein [Arenibaculum sp.]